MAEAIGSSLKNPHQKQLGLPASSSRPFQRKAEVDDPCSRDDLLKLIGETFLRGVTCFDQTDSTNTRAIRLLSSLPAPKSPHLVYAETQTAGRGRSAKAWWSAAGGLTFSVIIDWQQHGLSANQKPLLPLVTGLAVIDAVKFLVPEAHLSLKWPNDVFLAGRKLAGILTEAPSQSPGHVVIGVGLNVNNSLQHAPDSLSSIAISLAEFSGRTFCRLEILQTFLQQLETGMQSLATKEPILQRWSRNCLLMGKRITLETGSTAVTGVCLGLHETGAILIQTPDGPQKFMGGVVRSWD